MRELGPTYARVLLRDRERCTACRTTVRQVLTVHHVIPRELGGSDNLNNLTTLCANCHRIVHWLSVGERLMHTQGAGLETNTVAKRRLVALARRIRNRRLQEYASPLLQRTRLPLKVALQAVVERNGFRASERDALERTVAQIKRSLEASAWRDCSRRLVRAARYLSINARNQLVFRVPAISDARERLDGDVLLMWPKDHCPSIWSTRTFSRRGGGRFAAVNCTNVSLRWDELERLTASDWRAFARGVRDSLASKTRRWVSNVGV